MSNLKRTQVVMLPTESILLKLMRERVKFPSYNSNEMEEWYKKWIENNL